MPELDERQETRDLRQEMRDKRLKKKINVGILVGDDVKYLEGCIKSVFDYAERIYIYLTSQNIFSWKHFDTMSNTWRRYSSKMQFRQGSWNNDFAEARNNLLEIIPNDSWVLMIDPDERFLIKKGIDPIPKVEIGIDGFNLTVMGPHTYENKSNFIRSKFTRIFWKTSKTEYTNSVHEQVSPSIEKYGGKIAEVPPSIMRIIHLGYDISWALMEVKIKRNYEIMEKIRENYPDDNTNNLHLAKHYSITKEYQKAEPLYKDLLKTNLSDSNRGYILNELGVMALIRKDMKEAVEYFTEGLQYEDVNCIYNMGKINIWSPNILTIQKGVKMLDKVKDSMFINKDECKNLIKIGNENYMSCVRNILKENQ
jgi:tetratricopeptide (TPR) repeat protein